MKNILPKVIKLLGFGNESEQGKKVTEGGMSNQQLLDDLLLLFETSLKKESVRRRMLFPMYFDILMHPDDYNDRKDALAYVLPEVISSFMEVIERNRGRFPIVENQSTKWVFQFSPCRVDGELILADGQIINVEKGKLIKSAKLYYREEQGANIQVENNVIVSVKCDNSDVMNISFLNFEALKSVDIVDDGLYMYNYTDGSPISKKNEGHTEEEPKDTPESFSENATIATLTYTYQGQRIHYMMKDERISISGRKDKRNKRMVFKVENDNLVNDHVQIKYDRTDNEFYLCAFGETKLNQRSLELSKGGDVKWCKLANNSSIFMNDEIKVVFTKSK